MVRNDLTTIQQNYQLTERVISPKIQGEIIAERKIEKYRVPGGHHRTLFSGVAKLGHTGARATRGCAPPVQALLKIISAKCTVINRELGAKSAQRC